MSQISGQSSAIPQSEIRNPPLTPGSLLVALSALPFALRSLRIALKLIQLDIHQQAKLAALNGYRAYLRCYLLTTFTQTPYVAINT